MNTASTPTCRCVDCIGAACTCGCQDARPATTPAQPAACRCGPACTCNAGGAGCRCGTRAA